MKNKGEELKEKEEELREKGIVKKKSMKKMEDMKEENGGHE